MQAQRIFSNSVFIRDNYSGKIDMNSGKRKRDSSIKPLSSFLAKDWCHASSLIFKDVYEKNSTDYPRLYTHHASFLKRKVFPYVFQEKKWSALDFYDFIKYYNKIIKDEGYYFSLTVMVGKKFFKNLSKKDNEFLQRKLYDNYYSLVYCPHYSIFNDKNDLFEVLDLIGEEYSSGVLACYGIPIFHKYNQIRKNMSFDESCNFVSSVMKDILEKNKEDKDSLNKYFHTVAKNSVLWGPYCESAMLKDGELEKDFVIDWQRKYDKIWEFFKINKKDFWQNNINMKLCKPIPPVKYMFELDIKRSRE